MATKAFGLGPRGKSMLFKATRHYQHAIPVARGNPVGIPLWVSCMVKAPPSRGITKVNESELKSYKEMAKKKSGKPLSLKEFRKSPFWNETSALQKLEFEHDRLFTKFFKLNPDVLSTVAWKANSNYPPFEFVKQWLKLIKDENLNEKDAYAKVLNARNWKDEMNCKLNEYDAGLRLQNLFPGGLESQLRRKLREKDLHLQQKQKDSFANILQKANIKESWQNVTNDYIDYRLRNNKRNGGILRLLDIFAKKEDSIWKAAAESQTELIEKIKQKKEEKQNEILMKQQEQEELKNKPSVGVQGLVNSFFGNDNKKD